MYKAFAVCVKSTIDGGAPGYYAIAMCQTKEEAEKVKDFVNSCRKTYSETEPGTRRRWESIRYLEKFEDHNISFGYNEGDSSNAYIKDVNILEENDFSKLYYKFKSELDQSRKNYADKHDGVVDYKDYRLR